MKKVAGRNFTRDFNDIEVGDGIFFKDDIEQGGIVTEINTVRNWCGDLVKEVIVENECPYDGRPMIHVMDDDHIISVSKKDGTEILWGDPENWTFL